jgi:hypothetical protein
MEKKVQMGTPPPVFLPAKNYFFALSDEHHIIEIPRQGNYIDIDPEAFSEESGSFCVISEEKVNMLDLSKVLFAAKKYPDLEYNQFFVPYTISFDDEVVYVVGQVIEMVFPKKEEEE